MSDEKKAIEKIFDEGYKDIVHLPAKETGKFLGTIFSFFNWLVYPLEKGNIYREAKLKKFAEDMQKKFDQIPEDNRQEAKPNISIPALEALKYNLDEEHIKEMFMNLLTNSMDNRQNKNIHPSFVEIIKRMDNCDAQTLKAISSAKQWPIVSPQCRVKGTDKLFAYVFPEYYIGIQIDSFDMFDISRSLKILDSLGIIRIETVLSLPKESYEKLKKSEVIINHFEIYKTEKPSSNVELTFGKGYFMFTEFGNSFIKCCL